MINLPEHEDDIYLNAMIQIYSTARDRKMPFDLDTYRTLSRIITAEVDDRIGELFCEDYSYPEKRVDLAEHAFICGWAFERGLNCEQDFNQAASQYQKAVNLGSVEAKFRLGWLYENGLVPSSKIDPVEMANRLYKESAEEGHIKSLIACGQRNLFKAKTIGDLLIAQDYFQKANHLDPFFDFLYADAIAGIVEQAKKGLNWVTVDHLEYILPIIGHLKKGESVHYQRGIESNLRLAQYLHDNHKRTGTFFLSWCYLNGVGLPKNRDLGKKLAIQFFKKGSPVVYYYIAWVYLSEKSTSQIATGLLYLRLSAEAGNAQAKEDYESLSQLGIGIRDSAIFDNAVKSGTKRLNMECWFGF